MKIMAIDYGDAHTGVAISDLHADAHWIFVRYHRVPARSGHRKAAAAHLRARGLRARARPTHSTWTARAAPAPEKAEGFAEMLREATSLPVTLWDERRTTVDAHNILLNNGKRAKERKKTVDAVAASLMLEGYLTFKKRQG